MKITFDSQKDLSHYQKHGVSLSLASSLEWEWLYSAVDDRCFYGETRHIGYAPIGDIVYCVIFIEHVHYLRVISLRKANKQEVIRYAKQFNA